MAIILSSLLVITFLLINADYFRMKEFNVVIVCRFFKCIEQDIPKYMSMPLSTGIDEIPTGIGL
jgi:hypothetical protein